MPKALPTMNGTLSACEVEAPDALVRRLGEQGAVLWIDADDLCLSAPQGALDEPLLAALREGKPALLAWQRGAGALTPHLAQLRPSPEQALLLRAGDGADYVASGLFRLTPPAPLATAQEVLGALLGRHDALRAAFPRDADGQFLMTLQGQPPRPEPVDVSGLGEEALAALSDRLLAEEGRRPFDLAAGPLLRLRLLVDGEHVVALLIAAHHAIMDRWSMDLLGEEFALGLMAAQAGEHSSWAPAPAPSFAAAVARRGRACGQPEVVQATQAASAALRAELEPVALHGAWRLHDRDRPACRVDRVFPAALREALRRHGRPPVVQLCALSLLLARRTPDGRLCLGLPVARRPDSRSQDTVGLFASTVPLLLQMSAQADAARCLADAAEALDAAIALQEADMAQALAGRVSYGLSPFNVLVSFQSASRDLGTRYQPMRARRASAKADLVVFFDPCGMTLEYPEGLGEPVAMETFADDLVRVAEALLDDAAARADAPLPLSTPEAEPVAAAGPAAALWARSKQHPDAVVLTDWSVDPPAAFSARALARRVATVAAALNTRGVGVEHRVGVAVAGAAGRVVSVLAVLWVGAAYVPIDARWPESRRRQACEGLTLLLTDQPSPEPNDGPAVLSLEQALQERGPRHAPVTVPGLALSHVLHTSGSTGRPKRVGLTRGAMSAFVDWAVADCPGTRGRVMAMTPLSFDLSVFEMFAPLVAGGALAVLDSPLEVGRRLAACEPGLINTTPSVMRELLRTCDRLPSGCTVHLAGEPFGEDLVAAVHAAGAAQLVNLYGPTETTTYSSVAVIAPALSGAAPIGRPIAGTWIRLETPDRGEGIDRWRGEILIGGAGVARGYLAEAALTAASFLPAANGARLYATGDHARRGDDGQLHFLGRADRQVKRRGVRIELDEIESALLRQPEVAAVAAVFQPDPDGGRLVAIIVPQAGARPDTAALVSVLPAYMAPDQVHLVAALPTTTSGKLDRAALDLDRFEAPLSRPPRDLHEAAVATIWAAVVEREIRDRDARFFEVGGDSLKLMRVADGLQRRYGVAISPVELLRHPTVADMARLVAAKAAASSPVGDLA